MKKLTVFVADDSVVYRSQIKLALANIPGVEVLGAASNGKIAISRLQAEPVDLLILDLEMPEMDGLQTLQEITLRQLRCKVLVFSSASKRGAEVTLEALKLGASDFIAKPSATDAGNPTDMSSQPSVRIQALLQPKIEALFPAAFAAAARPSVRPSVQTESPKKIFSKVVWDLVSPQVIVIGSSTGGPTALESIFSQLRGPLKCPVFIAQHMPPIFTATLAERLQKISGIPASEATHGMKVEANRIYVAPGNFHMTLMGSKENSMVMLNQEPLINSVRPAVDPLFESAARIYKERCLGIVLTGMGADGKMGSEKVKESGGAVVIQDEASCVVFGMPGAVFNCGAYDKILTPSQILQMIQEKAGAPAATGGR